MVSYFFFNFREKKIEGLTFLRSLAVYHSDTLQGRLHDVCLSLIQEVVQLVVQHSHTTFTFSVCCFTPSQLALLYFRIYMLISDFAD